MSPSALEFLASREARSIDDLKALVRIPSLSGSPEHQAQMGRAASWIVERMQSAGIENAAVLETGGHPTVYGDWLHADGAPTILIYGHYDVQPAEPLDLWESPPFEPEERDGCLFGRGSADDKAGVVAAIEAVHAILATDQELPVNVKFCFEGEEEVGTPNLPRLIETERARFAADLVISVDGGQWSAEQPQVILGFRGVCALELHVQGPSHDLHSGLHGGSVLNPLEALARILASMRTPDGRISVEGFYDDVQQVPADERQAMAQVPGPDDQALAVELGVPVMHGEPGFTTRERLWIRPTLEINGIWGGYSGAGPKTIVPAVAHAKITCRLVADQHPDHIFELLREHVVRHTPPGVTSSLEREAGRAVPSSLAASHPANRAVAAVLEEVYGVAPFETRSGGSIPIVADFQRLLGAPTVFVGCCTQDCNLHAPNEFVHLRTFHRGIQTLVLLFERLATAITPSNPTPPEP